MALLQDWIMTVCVTTCMIPVVCSSKENHDNYHQWIRGHHNHTNVISSTTLSKGAQAQGSSLHPSVSSTIRKSPPHPVTPPRTTPTTVPASPSRALPLSHLAHALIGTAVVCAALLVICAVTYHCVKDNEAQPLNLQIDRTILLENEETAFGDTDEEAAQPRSS